MLEEGLVNHPAVGFGESGRKTNELRILFAKIEESEVCVLLGLKDWLALNSDLLSVAEMLLTVLVLFHSLFAL